MLERRKIISINEAAINRKPVQKGSKNAIFQESRLFSLVFRKRTDRLVLKTYKGIRFRQFSNYLRDFIRFVRFFFAYERKLKHRSPDTPCLRKYSGAAPHGVVSGSVEGLVLGAWPAGRATPLCNQSICPPCKGGSVAT